MAKVWVVTEGSYSDFHIEAVCSNPEIAEDFILSQTDPEAEVVQRTSGWSAHEWEVDKLDEPKVFRTVYNVALNLETGDVVERSAYSHRSDAYTMKGWRGQWRLSVPVHGYVEGKSVVSAEHAMKLAVEGRQVWLREKDTRIFNGYESVEEVEE